MPISLRLRKLTEKGDAGGKVEDGEVEDAVHVDEVVQKCVVLVPALTRSN